MQYKQYRIQDAGCINKPSCIMNRASFYLRKLVFTRG